MRVSLPVALGTENGRAPAHAREPKGSPPIPSRTVTCGMSAERWMLIQSLRPMSISGAFVRHIRKRHYLETS